MAPFTVHLLGAFELEYGGHHASSLGPAKADELWAFLCLRKRACPRDVPAAALWEGCTRDQARAYLRRALWQLQSGLRDVLGVEAADVLDVQPEWIARTPGAALALDTDAVDAAYARVLDRPGEALTPDEADAAERAVAAYRGDLLEACDAGWLVVPRERYRHQFLVLLEKLAAFYLHAGRPERALAHADRLVEYDVVRERSHRLLMLVLWRMGDRARALRQFELCTDVLRKTFDVAPLPETVALYRQVRTGHTAASEAVRPAPDVRPIGPPTGAGVEHVLRLLAEASTYLRDELGATRTP